MKKFLEYISIILFVNIGTLAYSQDANYYKECYPCQLKEVLKDLQDRYDYHFSYDADKVQGLEVEGELNGDNVRTLIQYTLEDAGLQPVYLNEREIMIIPIEGVKKQKDKKYGTICGKIRDFETKGVLPAAVIMLNGTEKGIYAEDNGHFKLTYSFSEHDSITVSYLGYDSQVFPVHYFYKKPCEKIFLKSSELLLNDIIVEENQLQLMEEGSKANQIIIRHDRMGDAPGLGEPDVLRIVQMLPGINSASGMAGQLNIHGGTPDENLILWDDIPIYHIGHFFGIFSPFNPYIIDEVSVFKGDFGVEYGERNSGVIDIESRPGKSGKPSFGLGLNGLNSHAYFELPLFKKRGGMLLAVRRSFENNDNSAYTNLIQRVFGNELFNGGDVHLDSISNTGVTNQFAFQDLNAKFFYSPKDKRSFSLSIFIAGDEITFLQNKAEFYFKSSDRLTMLNGGLSIKYKENWTDKFNTEFSLVSSNFENTSVQKYSADSTLAFQEQTINKNLLLDNYFKIQSEINHKRSQFMFGWKTSNQFIQHTYDYTHYHKTPVLVSRAQKDFFAALYLNYRYHLDDKLTFDLGVRLDQLKSFEVTLPAPRYSLAIYPLGPELKLKSSGGFYLQYIRQYFESDEFGFGNYYWLPLSEDYDDPVRTFQWSNGFTYLKNGYLFDAEAYVKRTENIAHRDNANKQELFLSFGNANILGFDFLLKKQFSRYSSWLAYSFNKTTYKFPYFEDPFPASHEQRHVLNWTHFWSLRNFDISFAWNLASGRPYTQGTDVQKEISPVTGDPYYEIVYGPINNERYPAFSRFDFSANYKLVKRLWRFKLGLSVLNVLNHQNILHTKYAVVKDNNQNGELVSTNRYLLPFTPNVFAVFEFN